MRTIVIDPGHGGHDTGIRGGDGGEEKSLNLALARLVAARLEGRHRVLLTRTGDYSLENADRVARANHVKADLFLSIHAAGGWSRDHRRLTVSYYEKSALFAGDVALDMPEISGRGPVSVFVEWDTVQHRHYTGSRAAAAIFRDDLSGFFNARGRIVETRLAALAGADMPAVMIEAGYLSRFKESGAPSLPRLADAIGKAVERVVDEL